MSVKPDERPSDALTRGPSYSIHLLLAVASLLPPACSDDTNSTAVTSSQPLEMVPLRDEPLEPLPPAPRVDARRAAVGARLFNAANLSADGSVSCVTCHPLDRAGADGLMHSRGAYGREMALNTPTIYNASFNFRFNWNGSYATLEDSFDAPIVTTMGTSWTDVVAKLRGDPALSAAFAAAYSDGVTTANVKDALARYVDTLVTPDARFDQYLRGDTDALTPHERRGYELFKTLGCVSCHQGANVGGNLFQRLGVMHDYFKDRVARGGPAPSTADLGRFGTTNQPADRYVFRVPSLRNTALTPPYFHDGSIATLEQAVSMMGYLQLGRRLTTEQVSLLVAFLKTLTGLPSAKARGSTTP
jgi:cytochrome c peroxidase